MRDLEQCRAEVFRRSENRIKERTRMRRRAVTMCVPLVLCLVIGAVTAPMLLRDGKSAAPVVQEVGSDSMTPAAPQDYEFSSVDDAAALLRSYAPADENDGRKHVSNQTDGDPDFALPPEDTASETVDNAVIGYSGTGDRRVTVTTPEGEIVYVISGDLLRCETEGWERSLTQEEAEELYEALDLPEEDGR